MNDVELEERISALAGAGGTLGELSACVRLLLKRDLHREARRLIHYGLRRWPSAHQLQLMLGELALRERDLRAAAFAFASASAIAPHSHQAQEALAKLLRRETPTWHFPMMNDQPRNEAFDQAIRAKVRPGMHVLDIGCGGGLLSLMAARAGGEVIACEVSEHLIPVAREIIAENGYQEQIKLFQRHSTSLNLGVELDQPAELLICEIFDVSLFGEDALHTIQHARRHLLSEDAEVIPAGARLWALPVSSPMLRDRFVVDQSVGFELGAFNQLQELRPLQIEAQHFDYQALSEPLLAAEVDFLEPNGPALSGEAISAGIATQSGTYDGVLFWYELLLDREGDVILSTAPDQPGTHWRQCFFPAQSGGTLEAGDHFQLMTRYRRYWLDFQLIGVREK
ncbi:MAG: methyltransferase domain-containing protein [Myxococcota bacterium]|nr:methyltransferase domain-containing protein [Myxococcota bacterium]